MKSIKATISLLLLSSVSAFAADLPSIKSAPAATPCAHLAGFYAGLNAGYVFGTSNGANTTSVPLLDQWAKDPLNPSGTTWNIYTAGATAAANTQSSFVNQNGFIGGGQIGYNYQYDKNLVLSLEVDMQGTTIRGNGNYTGFSSDNASVTSTGEVGYRNGVGWGQLSAGVNWLGTVRGRVGFLITPTLMLYATGGLAYGGVNASSSNNFLATNSDNQVTGPFPVILGTQGWGNISQTQVGYSAGGGAEWMAFQNWSVKAEAIYYDLGSVNFNSGTIIANYNWSIPYGSGYPAGYPLTINNSRSNVSFQGIIARAGVNYHFNFASVPVVAKF